MQGFIEADPFVLPQQKVPPPEPAPPDGPFLNPTLLLGYSPPGVDSRSSGGFYPYSEGGYLDLRKDGTFAGILRVNIGGNTVPYDTSHPTEGRYKLNGDGTGVLTFLNSQAPVLEVFMVIINPAEEMLLTVVWVNTADNHRRSTGTGLMKRMS